VHRWKREKKSLRDNARTNAYHDGDLTGGPSIVGVSSEMLGAHDVIRSTIRLTGDNSNLRDSRL
jgi:hypothetical protein